MEACKTFQDLSNFKKVILDLLAIHESLKNHRKIFWSLQNISGLVKLQEGYLGPFGNPWKFLKSLKNILKLDWHSRTCQTSRRLSWTFWQSMRVLKIIEKYFEAWLTFQDMSNFKKVILDLLAIHESFKNHRKIFWSLIDIPGLVKLQEGYLGPFDNLGDFYK